MYKKVSPELRFVEREAEISEYWKRNGIFEKSIENREGCPVFTFFDGPPTANGIPHIGHVLTRVVKDIIPRYKTMKGYKVLRKAGWDTHGLPVELEVEKELGIDGKPRIEEYGVEPFVGKCKESVWKYEKEWEEMSDRVGYWADMENPYVTYHDNYIESVWWALRKIWDRDLIYKGYKIVPYCPRCGTALSSHEVAQGYKDVKDNSVIVKFKSADRENTYFLAWTTTPWTLPSNVALTLNPRERYVKAAANGEFYIVAKALADKVLPEEYQIISEYEGSELEKKKYEPLFTWADPEKEAHYLCTDEFVTMSDGTGIVHTAPAFGEDDANVGRKYDLPFVQMVNEQGCFIEEAGELAGIFAKDADKLIIDMLQKKGLLYGEFEYEHSYPFCWRCDTPLLYYARSSWFIKMTEMRDELVKNNNTVNWLPDSIGKGRFGNFLEGAIDWGISRERYWGTPLPIWECECGHRHMVGSKAELAELSTDKSQGIPELHKPYVDGVKLRCGKCAGEMTRVPEVIDCWFDSGAMPFAQWHYPFENKEIFEENFPADFISEAVDQTRGWFYTLMAISTLLFECAPYKNVIVLGHVLDKDGVKMSKHKGNVVAPKDVLDTKGADALRWYFYSASSPWLPNKFSEEAVGEAQRKFMGTLWNTYAFYILYAELDGFNPTEHEFCYDTLSVMDKWIISKLHSLIKTVDEELSVYHITEPARSLQIFADELSNWYVRRCRERYWQPDMNRDKINAYMTLKYVLETLAGLTAPFLPFIAEQIYLNIVKSVDEAAPESIHLCDFPKVNEGYINKDLEQNMSRVLDIVLLGRNCRNTASIKNRQPVSCFYVKSDDGAPDSEYIGIAADELNAGEIIFTDDVKGFTTYTFKPQLKTVGPKYGKLVGRIGKELTRLDGNAVMDDFDSGKDLVMNIDGSEVVLNRDDLLITKGEKEGYTAASEGGLTVVLNTSLTPELIEKGFVRELISKIQQMRKEAGFEVVDRIVLGYSGSEKLSGIMSDNSAQLCDEVLAKEAVSGVLDGYVKTWDINGETVGLSVKKTV